MAGSQLKRLKASLKEQGIIGPQQSKKQKRKNALDQKASSDKRLNRSEALEGIREQFNPFQFKTSARGPKFEVTTIKPANDKTLKGVNGRPGLAKSMAEERRRGTLLVEMQRRNKVGGLVDRRFGENDPTMSLEDKMIERFTREQQRNLKKGSVFDLEDDNDELGEDFLTHGGKKISFGDEEYLRDDFAEKDLPSGDESAGSLTEKKRLKRLRFEQAGEEDSPEEDNQPERKKSKKEIYEEIIAKSKLHKYERQAAKEEDSELRAELDKELREVQSLLFQRHKVQPRESNQVAAPVVIAGVEKTVLDKEYDVRVKQLAADKRAKPAERTKTEEEKLEEESKRLKELEEKRQKRMRGEVDSSEDEEMEDDQPKPAPAQGVPHIHESRMGMIDHDEKDEFGLGKGIKLRLTATELGLDDEDDFEIDDDLIASGSELDLDSDEYGSEGEEGSEEEESDDEDDEFTKGLLTGTEFKDPAFQVPADGKGDDKDGIPYTFPCPQTHEELVKTFQSIGVIKTPVAVQRIRALYHPKLDSRNKERLGNFCQALIQHVVYLGDRFEPHWFPALESVIRHIHSLAKTFPIEVAKGYRACLLEMERERPLNLTVGDLLLLTGIGSTYPTSDHFHQVVTPAMLSIGRFLGQKIPQTLSDYATGTYLSILAVQYQQLSKRYVPELVNFCLNTLCALAPQKPQKKLGCFPLHQPAAGIRIQGAVLSKIRKLNCCDCQASCLASLNDDEVNSLKVAIVITIAAVLKAVAEIWHKHAAFHESFQPAVRVLEHLTSKANAAHVPTPLTSKLKDTATAIERLMRLAHLARRPLELHHHRPLAIRTYVPKFEDSFDPNKHYDPNRERAELAKLRAEHKRERKGAMRELRKDAAFMQRENLRIKKAKDEAYEKKFKRLVAEIQGEEGHAANEYAREKAKRKRR